MTASRVKRALSAISQHLHRGTQQPPVVRPVARPPATALPHVLPPVTQALLGMTGAQGQGGPIGAQGMAPSQSPVNQAASGVQKKQSDPRFRSFVERYLIERVAYFSLDPDQHAKDQWDCILDAKRAYAMVNRAGQGWNDSEDF